MTQTPASIRDISDTAWWTAVYRARESERPDALFHDPLARRLAGDRGRELWPAAHDDRKSEWSMAIRTLLFDQLILEQATRDTDLVINLAAGLDARPYRMPLPPELIWVEVDLPGIIAYKESVLQNEKPVCRLERMPLDLSDVKARRGLFEQLGRRASNAIVISEGLLVYLSSEEVGSLAEDLGRPPSLRRWIVEVVSPGLLRLMQRHLGEQMSRAGAGLKFAPEDGPGFLKRFGWTPVEVRSFLKTGAREKRVPFWTRLLARLPEPAGRQGSFPWAGVCLFERRPG